MTMVGSGGDLHVMDALVYATSKIAYSSTSLGDDPTTSTKPSYDVALYVGALADRFNRFTADDRRSVARRVQTAYISYLADPTLFWSVWATIDAVGSGRRVTRMPLPSVRRHVAYL